MAGPAKGPHQLDRLREEQALELFRYVGTFDAVAIRLGRQLIGLGLLLALAVLAYVANVVDGLYASTAASGVLHDSSLRGAVSIRRDGRDVPHIAASSEPDLYFAQGFAEATDRLFQMELTRRYALGTLAEVLGARALAIDEEQRDYDVRRIAAAQWRLLGANDRNDLEAFARGVNAAMREQPLPVEFRLLLFAPRPWTPQDSLAVSLAVSIALGDSWRDVLARDDVWRRFGERAYDARFPLSDPRYDVSLRGDAERRGALRRAQGDMGPQPIAESDIIPTRRPGSNAWAAGGTRTASGNALLANDPHLELTIPGLWYLVDLQAPGVHVAGAAIPGAPGVALGHNERIAWGATNADVASTSVFETGRLARAAWTRERFVVRFAGDVTRSYYRFGGAFGVSDPYDRYRMVLVRSAHLAGASPISTFLALDRAATIDAALGALARYRGPAENFVLADTHGDVAYHLAGAVVADAAWGRYVHRWNDFGKRMAPISFARLPAIGARGDGTIVSANNKMYDRGYPYRLAPYFDPPYRAYRIAELLRARTFYDAAYFERMQLDEVSAVDREFARRVAAIAARGGDLRERRAIGELWAWDGTFSPDSRAATLEHALRGGAEANAPSLYAALEQLRHGDVTSSLDADLAGSLYYANDVREPWGRAGAVPVEHPLAPLHFGFLNGATLPGAGDEYTIRLQEPGFSQSFRAVWDLSNWDNGGISIPSGESGRPGSSHYVDLSASWIAGHLEALPFTERAIEEATRAQLILSP